MVATIARHLHQPIFEIEGWDVPTFYRYFDHMSDLLKIESANSAPDDG